MASIFKNNLTQVEIKIITEKMSEMVAIPFINAPTIQIVEHRNIAYIFVIQNFKISVCRLRIYKYLYKKQNELGNFKIIHKIQFDARLLQLLQDLMYFSQAKAKQEIVVWKTNIFKIMKEQAIAEQEECNYLKPNQKQYLKFIQILKNELQNLLDVRKILVDHLIFSNLKHQYELRLLVDLTNTKSVLFYIVECSQNEEEQRKIRFKMLTSQQQLNFTLEQMIKEPIINFHDLRKQIQTITDAYKIIQIMNKPEFKECNIQIFKLNSNSVDLIGFWKINKVYKFEFKIFLENKKICFQYEYESRFIQNKGIYENKLMVIQDKISFNTYPQFVDIFKRMYKLVLENWEICNQLFPKLVAALSRYHFDFETITVSEWDIDIYNLGMIVLYDFPIPIFIKFTFDSVKKVVKCVSPIGQIEGPKQFFVNNFMRQFDQFTNRINNVTFSTLRNCTLIYNNAKSIDQEWIVKKLCQFDILYVRSPYCTNYNIGLYLGNKKVLNFKYDEKYGKSLGRTIYKKVLKEQLDIYKFISKCQIRILRWNEAFMSREQILQRIAIGQNKDMKSFGITKNLQQKVFQIIFCRKMSPQVDILQDIISSRKKEIQQAENILRYLKDLRSQDDDSVLMSGIDFIGAKIAKDLKTILSTLHFHLDQLTQFFWCFNKKELV